jgi:hypothetical protein
MPPPPDLAAIPVVDVRHGGAVRHALEGRDRAQALRDDCLSWLPGIARAMLPAMDAVTRHWLKRSRSPYLADVTRTVDALGISGIWFLNGAYQWGCTALARDQGGVPWLARTLDWPFPGLGRYVEIARMQGPAGPFDNVTWPGFVGTLTASAPGRFAAAINQAPLWRRTRHPWLRPCDMAMNALRTWRIRFMPPDHLLREVFESCKDFGAALRCLETTPVARPVIFILVGCERGEHCVIERTEQGYLSHNDDTAVANDWLQSREPWEARMPSDVLLTRSYEEAAARSRARQVQLAAWPGQFASDNFDWVTPPVLNRLTRVAVEMCPAKGLLRAVGYETATGAELPAPVTRVCELAAAIA